MFSIDEIKKKRESYERKIEEILKEFERELPPEIKIESSVVLNRDKSMKCSIKLEVEDLNS
jgi:hypothetical protein